MVLKLKDGSSPSQDVVEGIAHLVASSVDGLDSERVTVLDDGGHMLSSAHEAGSLAGLSSQQLDVQREIESDLENRTERIISQTVGPRNTRVQVSALGNYDRVERTIDNLVLNPSGSGGTRHLMLSVAVEVKDDADAEQMKARDAEVRDAVLHVLGSKTVDELADIAARDSLKLELRVGDQPRFRAAAGRVGPSLAVRVLETIGTAELPSPPSPTESED